MRETIHHGTRVVTETVEDGRLVAAAVPLSTTDSQTVLAQTLIIATGATARRMGIPAKRSCGTTWHQRLRGLRDGALPLFRNQTWSSSAAVTPRPRKRMHLTKFGSKVIVAPPRRGGCAPPRPCRSGCWRTRRRSFGITSWKKPSAASSWRGAGARSMTGAEQVVPCRGLFLCHRPRAQHRVSQRAKAPSSMRPATSLPSQGRPRLRCRVRVRRRRRAGQTLAAGDHRRRHRLHCPRWRSRRSSPATKRQGAVAAFCDAGEEPDGAPHF